MNHIGLFAGIGGFELAAQATGWNTIAWCEINPFCQTVLKYHFPNATGHEDIRTTDFTVYRGQCDIVTGGFPCQPFSVAGKRKGTDDNRFIWPEMFRAIREINPAWVVAENVYGLVSQERGMVFKRVLTEMETIGYEVQPFIIPACSIGAPHKRDRVWIIANTTGIRRIQSEQRNETSVNNTIGTKEITSNTNNIDGYLSGFRASKISQFETSGVFENIDSNTFGSRFKEYNTSRIADKQRYIARTFIENWENWPTQSPICGRNDGLSYRLDGITFHKFRRESIKAFGNAIVPQVAYQIFKAINEIENDVC